LKIYISQGSAATHLSNVTFLVLSSDVNKTFFKTNTFRAASKLLNLLIFGEIWTVTKWYVFLRHSVLCIVTVCYCYW